MCIYYVCIISKDKAARRKEKDELVITMWGREVYTSCCAVKERWYSKVKAENVENEKSDGEYGDGQMPVVRAGRERIPSTLAVPRYAEMERGAPEQQMATYQRENSVQGGAVNSATEQRNLGALAYKINCKWENETKGVLRLGMGDGGGQEVGSVGDK